MKRFKKALFVFNRDLRMTDNHALASAFREADAVACAFVVDPVFNHEPEKRFQAKQFLLASLGALDHKLHEIGSSLLILSGGYADVVTNFVTLLGFDSIYVNREYTDAGCRRQRELQEKLAVRGVPVLFEDDAFLFPPGFVLKADGKPYTVFTPFYNRARQYPVEKPVAMPGQPVLLPIDKEYALDINQLARFWQVSSQVGDMRKLRMDVLDGLGECAHYEQQRDFPAQDATSRLSAHLRFGTISIREAYWAIIDKLGSDSPLLRQLYWRDFFAQIGFHFPHVFHSAFHAQYANIKWSNDREKFRRWCEGSTGFPIVDAGMRELNQTGFMHNRVRMIVASFLVKDLHVDWRWGERYFRDQLVDYDRAVNNGNWQWAASTGCDAQPYFRIFNPWLQQQKFDPECEYIYQWVPELGQFSPRDIHRWHECRTVCDYPLPMLDHASCSQRAKELFRRAAELAGHAAAE